ncbi:MAG TPA: Gam protein [Thermoclostridium sp.]
MKKNVVTVLVIGVMFLSLVLTNLYSMKKILELNEQLTRIFELEDTIASLRAEHQREIEALKAEYEKQIKMIDDEYSEKFDTVTKALNAFEYEIEEFYKNKFIVEKDYLENIKKINDVRAKLEDGN